MNTATVPLTTRCDYPKTSGVAPWGYRPGAVCVVMRSRSRFPKKGERPTYRLDIVTETGRYPSGDWYIAKVASGAKLHVSGNSYHDGDNPGKVVNRSIGIVGRPRTLRSRDLWTDHQFTVWRSIDALTKVVESYMEPLP